MNGPPPRRLLATDQSIGESIRIYRAGDALEVDVISLYNIRRRRVFFDEVQLVTLHSRRGLPPAAVAWGALALLMGLTSNGIGRNGDPRTLSIFLAVAAAFALGSLGSMLMPVWTVTVFGKRTRARLRFRLRGGKARRIYGEICRAVAEAQEDAAHRTVEVVEEAPS
jgi:hypothetical protein